MELPEVREGRTWRKLVHSQMELTDTEDIYIYIVYIT